MKKKFVVSILVIILMVTLACSISYEGVSIGDDPEPINPLKVLMAEQTFEAMLTVETVSVPADVTPEHEYQSVIPSGSDSENVVAGSHEYSVNETNFDCTCQETENMMVDFNFSSNQVEITNSGGGETMVYDKISENKYQRSFMGYYILTSEVGDQATETKVEEEQHIVIILTNNGHVMESNKGSSSSPC